MNRPSTGVNGPNTSIPGGNFTRPGGGATQLPANRPGGNAGGVNRPGGTPGSINRPGGTPGGVNRPGGNSPGQVGDFLGMDRPVQLPSNRPGTGNLPNRPGAGNLPNRPGAGGSGTQRPGAGVLPNRPGGDNRPNRPGGDNRQDWARADRNRPININNSNNIISNRPSWSNISGNDINRINGRWNNSIRGSNWNNNINNRWNHWGNGVRGWGGYAHGYANGWFNRGWWDNHRFPAYRSGYWNGFYNHPFNYWWTVPAWGAVTGFFNWASQPNVVTQPIYYDYGSGGNVTYQDNSVYIGGQQVATADEFAESAAALATVEPPANETESQTEEWLPLGTFAISTNEKESEPNRVLQLAVNKDGVISGALFNTETNDSKAILGRVDKETQRVAIRIGENQDVVAETGLYNLTQDEVPLLVHFGKDKQETWLLVRMKAPEDDQSGAAGEGAGSVQ
jgi:hypothetical protein